MAGLNKVMLIGRLVRDPEIMYTQQGLAIVNFTIATSETWNDKTSGEKQKKTEWHRIKVFGKQAEICAKYLSKGRLVYIEGQLRTNSWEKDGQTHYTTEIVTSNFQFLESKSGSQTEGSYQAGGSQARPSQQPSNRGNFQEGPSPNSQNYQGPTNPGMTGGSNVIPDDDIPF